MMDGLEDFIEEEHKKGLLEVYEKWMLERDRINLGLSGLMELAIESFEIKREALEGLTERGLYPYSKFYLMRNKLPEFQRRTGNNYNLTSVEPFYTNSTQLPVDYTDDPFLVLEHQEDLQIRYKIPYFTITPTFSVCPSHGYIPEERERW